MQLKGNKLSMSVSLKIAIVGLTCLFVTPVVAQEDIDAEARSVLEGMSDYLSSQETLSVNAEATVEIVTFTGQKLQFISSGAAVMQRPGNLSISRKGALLDAEMYLSDSTFTIYIKTLNAFISFPDQATVEQAVDMLETDLDFSAPGLDFFISNPADRLLAGTTSGQHVGMTIMDNQSVHHLAFRNDSVDWQIWITDSATPLPLKYVVTSKWISGAPQYSIRFSDWVTGATPDASVFKFTPPDGVRELENISTNAVGELSMSEE